MKNNYSPSRLTQDEEERNTLLKETISQCETEGSEASTKGELTLNKDVEERRWRYFLALFLIGIVNNNGYVLV